MPKIIIGLGHQKNVGKDTYAKYCIDHLRSSKNGLKIVRRGFADKLYDILHILYGWAGFKTRQYYLQNPEAKNQVIYNGKTVRQMLIEFGTPVCRAWDDDIWINAALRDQDYDILFVSDLRFPNEFTKIKEMGGICVKITRPELPEPTDIADTALNGQTGWDKLVENNGGHSTLYKQAEIMAQSILLQL